VLPLTARRIDAYLRQAGIDPDATRVVLGDPILWDPLMLTMATRAVQQQADALQPHGSFGRRRAHLVATYPAIMLAHQPRYRPADAMRWLHHLACLMRDYPEVNPEFRLEELQPDWLPAPKERVFRRLLLATVGVVGAVFGGLTGAAYGAAANVALPRIPELKPLAELLVGPGLVLLGAALGALIGGVTLGVEMWRGGLGRAIGASEEPWWSWPTILSEMRSWLYAGLLIGLLVAVIVTHSDQWDAWIAAAPEATALLLLLGAPFAGVLGGLIAALLTGLFRGFSFLRRTLSSTPNEGIRWAVWNVLFFWVAAEVAGLITYTLMIVLFSDLPADIRMVLLVALHTGLLIEWSVVVALHIGSGYVQHYLLRALLVPCGYAPWRYVHFLDYATKRHLLRRVGGAYAFIHPILCQHFADLRFDEPL